MRSHHWFDSVPEDPVYCSCSLCAFVLVYVKQPCHKHRFEFIRRFRYSRSKGNLKLNDTHWLSKDDVHEVYKSLTEPVQEQKIA